LITTGFLNFDKPKTTEHFEEKKVFFLVYVIIFCK
ncbi:unnamed protein product, partial [Staurois parvus]